MPELFIEFFSEEIPARMQLGAAENLKSLATKFFADAGYGEVALQSYVTPRRLVLVAPDLPAQQPDRAEEIKGPRVDAPEAAIKGFMQASGLVTLEGLEQRVVGKGTHYFITRQQAGRATAEVLPEVIAQILQAFPWPKSMRWGTGAQTWVRPLQAVNVVFDGALMRHPGVGRGPDFESDVHGSLGSGLRRNDDVFCGHRFLSPKTFAAHNFFEYQTKLRENFVILDQSERRTEIAAQVEKLAAAKGLHLRPDDALLDEVTGLVEWPTAMMGSFDAAFLDVPQECLIATMRANQKYFALFDGAGKLANYFILISNMTAAAEKQIVAGNERVLRARLSDAKFFYEQDLKTPLADYVEKLKAIQFHEKLGTVFERVARMKSIAEQLALSVGAKADFATRAAELCKADLVTGMVGEFPELQGIMGRYYALAAGEDAAVADAIRDHYQPAGPSAPVPTAPVSIVLALADKLDVLNEFFRIDEKPTGSKDPFALRRAALGIIRILLENEINLPLSQFARPDVIDFIKDRLLVALRDRGIGHDRVKASMADQDDVLLISQRAQTLQNLLDEADGTALLESYRRAANILKAEEKKDGKAYDAPVTAADFALPVEKDLVAALEACHAAVAAAMQEARYDAAARALAGLRPALAAFFDNVMVNDADAAVRANRLHLLGRIRHTFHQFADFSLIEG